MSFLTKTKIFFKKHPVKISLLITLFSVWFFCLPSPLFNDPFSTVLEDRNNQLLSAMVADDGQWRFAATEAIPEKFKQSLIHFEDRYFYHHPGINPWAMVRAVYLNIKNRERVSGGSTLTMQAIRLARKNRKRTILEKVIEVFQATRLELTYSKKEILSLYSAHAPFGSNVVGLEAASWRYFGRSPEELSWAEAATLAVLPNSPGLIYPGKNHEKLIRKRNKLLDKLEKYSIIDEETCRLSKLETLPEKPYPLPQHAKHLLSRSVKEGNKGKTIVTTIDGNLQLKVNEILLRHYLPLYNNGINNAAVLVLDVETGEALAYAGNIPNFSDKENGHDVDVITAPRSTGSTLKPFLYAAMLNEGEILPDMLVADIPTNIGGYYPKNYFLTFDGAVPAKRAIARSLNVPAVRMLHEYGVEKFIHVLRKLGLTTITRNADHYGLSLILGGAEATLWDQAGVYASMARTLNNYTSYNGKYNNVDLHPAYYLKNRNSNAEEAEIQTNSVIDAASIWLAFEAMVEVARPDEESSWKSFSSAGRIAWKTGTSFGHRDGWAIGLTSKYVVGVWTGNCSGEGRPGLTGIGTAAPVMFEIFSLLESSSWFDKPFDEMEKIPVCMKSGHRASNHCEPVDSVFVQSAGLKTIACPFHKLIHLDRSESFRVDSDCENVSDMVHVPWFILPPSQEWYYKTKNPLYRSLPPFRSDCKPFADVSVEFIYPRENSKILVPREIDGKPGRTVFEAAHRTPGSSLYWHLDGTYIGITTHIHQLGLNPSEGKHTITIVDEKGVSASQNFEVVKR
jgi:penicillin-binding protein 1C